MPFIRQQQAPRYGLAGDDKEQRKTLSFAGVMPAPAAGTAAASAPSAPSAPAAAGGLTTPSGSNYVNLADYVRANQGAGQALTDKVLGGANQQAAELKQGQGSLGTKQLGVQRATPGTFQFTPGAPLVTQQRQQGGSPLAGQSAVEAAQRVEETGRLAGTMGGRAELLNQQFGKDAGGYSQGENDLDNALMGAGSGGRLEAAGKNFTGLTDMVRERQARQEAIAAQRDAGERERAELEQLNQKQHDAEMAAEAKRESELDSYTRNPPEGEYGTQKYRDAVNELNSIRRRKANRGATFDPRVASAEEIEAAGLR